MPASTEQKVDFLLKKIGYTATKSGLAEDSSLSGTKKAPFAEAIPSPIAIPSSNVWADSSHIPTTPPGSDTAYVKGYRTANAVRMTADSSVSGSRAFIAYTTYGNTSSAILGDWIDTQFSADYIVKVYKGDPNSGGVQLSAAGAGSNDTWFFDYASGVLNFNGTQIPSGVDNTNIYIVAYRYIGAKGALPPAGIATFTQLYVSGISTFQGNIDANAGLDVDGQTDLDVLNVAETATFSALIDANARIDVAGGANIDQVNVTGVSSYAGTAKFDGLVDVNNRLDVAGGANIDQLNLTGVSTFLSAVDINSTLDVDGDTQVDDLNVAGVATFSSLIDANARLDVVGGVNADQLNVVGVSSYAGLVDINAGGQANTFKVEDLTSGRVVLAGTGGEIEDSGNLTFNGTKLTVTGNAQITTDLDVDGGANIVGGSTLDNLNVTGVTTVAVAIDANGTLDVDGDTQLDDLNVAGVATFSSAVDINSTLDVDGDTQLDDLNVTGVSTFTALVDVNNRLDVVGGANIDQVNVTGVSTYGGNVDINANVDVSGTTTLNDDVTLVTANGNNIAFDKSNNWLEFGDSVTARFGDTGDLQISHNGSDSIIKDAGVGRLKILGGFQVKNVGDTQTLITANTSGANATNVELYHGGEIRFETTGIGVSVHAGTGNTATLAGPADFIIDPDTVGDNTGSVRIKGDLYVDGTNFTVASGTIELADHVVGIATTSGTNAILDGGGIGIGSDNIRKTFVWNNATAALKSSEHLDIATGKVYKINGDNVLSSDTLGTNILYSSLQTVGVLRGLNVSGVSTFAGNIDANGALDVDGNTTLDNLVVAEAANIVGGLTADQLNVTGVSTYGGVVDINNNVTISGTLDVDGDTQVDDLNVAGVATFSAAIDANGTLDVDGDTQLDDLNVSGVSTFLSLVDVNNRIDVVGGANIDQLNLTGVSTFAGTIDANGNLDVDGQTDLDVLNVAETATFSALVDVNNRLDVVGGANIDQANVSGISTLAQLKMGSVSVTHIRDEDNMSSDSDTSLATQQSIKAYVDSQVTAQDLDVTSDSGTIAIDLDSETLDIAGTANEIETSASGNEVTIGLPNAVTILDATISGGLGVTGVSTFTGTIDANGLIDADGGANIVGGATIDQANVTGVSTFTGTIDANGLIDADGGANIVGGLTVDQVNATGISTLAQLKMGSVTATSILDEDNLGSDSDVALATQQSIKAYVDSQVTASDLDFQADTGGALSIDLDSETLTIAGTANEIETAGSGNQVTIGLPNAVTIIDTTISGGLGVTGVSTFTGTIDANGLIDADGGANIVGGATIDQANVTGVSTFTGTIDANGLIDADGGANIVGGATIDQANVTGVSTFTGNIDANGELDVDGHTNLDNVSVAGVTTFASNVFLGDDDRIIFGDGGLSDAHVRYDGSHLQFGVASGSYRVSADTASFVNYAGTQTLATINSTGVSIPKNLDVDGGSNIVGGATIDQINATGISTLAQLKMGSVTATAILDEDNLGSDSDTSLATQQSIKAYVDSQVTAQDLDFQADSGGALSIDLDSETLGIIGTSNEIETSGSGNNVTIGLPNAVTILDATISGLNVSGVTTTTNLHVGSAGTTITTNNATSSVGINSTSPAYMLDVGGIINSSTDVRINGTSVVDQALNDAVAMAIALG